MKEGVHCLTEDDFGFTLENENDLKKVEVIDTRAKEIWKIIEPFLDNLMKNPEKDVIKWPGQVRVKVITEVKQKIQKIMED